MFRVFYFENEDYQNRSLTVKNFLEQNLRKKTIYDAI